MRFASSLQKAKDRRNICMRIDMRHDRTAGRRQQRSDAGSVPSDNGRPMRDDTDTHGARTVDAAERMVGILDRHDIAKAQFIQGIAFDHDRIERLDVVIAAHRYRAAEARTHDCGRDDLRDDLFVQDPVPCWSRPGAGDASTDPRPPPSGKRIER